ncbi:hypothetical protein [Clostridium lundense]|uniref:hypothetical protein n=1 Tax=Clostridium lundense TaxID=319475 RepID=UPI000A6FFCCF|nr:hypothetical protein [Clostridium lundense]
MGNKKFDEFYFENDKNYPDSIYWDSFEVDRRTTEEKYDNHMFCPLCHSAPITVVKGAERRYFKVDKTDMSKHNPECSYKLDEANKTDTKEFYGNLDTTDIKNRLISCMNRMLKKRLGTLGMGEENAGSNKKRDVEFLNFKTKEQKKKYLLHKNLLTKFNDDDLKIQKIFYGECDISVRPFKVEDEIKRYYLKIMPIGKKYKICDVSIAPSVYTYLEDILKDIPEEGVGVQKCYICFSGLMEKKIFIIKDGSRRYSHSCILKDSRLIVIEKSL